MNKLVFRFYVIKENRFFEVSFDSRISFIENFKLIQEIYPFSIADKHIYDIEKGTFLNLNVPLSLFNFSAFTRLYIL